MPQRVMSALGQRQKFASQKVITALLPKAYMCSAFPNVCFGPIVHIGPQSLALVSGSALVLALSRHWRTTRRECVRLKPRAAALAAAYGVARVQRATCRLLLCPAGQQALPSNSKIHRNWQTLQECE